MHVCTIVSRGSLARARVMAATLREHHPEAALTVLLLDGDREDVEDLRGASVLAASSIVGDAFGQLAAANPPGALAISVLPALLRELFDGGERAVLYIGAGQRLLGPLDELLALLDTHAIALVARSRTVSGAAALSQDSGGPFSRQMLAVRADSSTDDLLAAWPRFFAVADDGAGAVRDWIASIPALVQGVAVLRGEGYALDPWSLTSRTIDWSAGTAGGRVLEVDGARARALDLSGLDPADPPSWFDGAGRVQLSSAPPLAELVEAHAADLRAAGLPAVAEERVPFTRLHDGLRLTDTVRSLTLRAIADGDLAGSPFTDAGRAELYRYLNEPEQRGRGAGLTRLHMAIWDARADLRASYPHIDGPDGTGYAGWLCVHGQEQEGLVPALLPPAPDLAYRDADPHRHEGEPRWGANVVGFFTAELGVGEAARLLIAGLDAGQVPALPVQGQLMPPSRRGVDFSYARPDEAAYPINILCINGDGISVFAREAGRSFFAGRYTIALWFWEVGEPPADWAQAYEFVEEVWVASQHMYDEIAPTAPVPVVRMKLPVQAPAVAERTRSQLGLPEDCFLFLYVHDYHSVMARKNPIGLIEAFARAFAPGSGAKLVIKSINADSCPAQHERVVLAAAAHADVTLIDAYVSAAEKNAMIAACDCYVSLHRSEGFGLTVAEAMALGKPVIATRYGGTMEFTTDANAYLVRWDPIAVGEGAYPYAADARWADPDLDHAASLMRHVRAEPEQARERGRRAQRDVLDQHSAASAGAAMARRLALVRARLQQNGVRSLNLAHLPSSDRQELIDSLIGSAPTISWGGGRMGRLRWRAQRQVATWSRAYVEHQSKIDSEMHKAIARMDARLAEVSRSLHDEQSAYHAETLAVLRDLRRELDGLRHREAMAGGQLRSTVPATAEYAQRGGEPPAERAPEPSQRKR